MFSLHHIQINNFRSYKGTHEFEFPLACGLYFFTGTNLVDPGLASNGSGKSTFLDAITWCLFGRTTRGLKANEVLSNWGDNPCQVTLDLTVEKRVRVKRTQKPNNLYLDERLVDQIELEKHIRLNFESFLYSVINTQFGQSFLSLSPGDKLTLFSDIMGLDFWLKKSEEASKSAKAFQERIDGLQLGITKAEGQLVTVVEDIESLVIDESSFEAGKAEKKEDLVEEKRHLQNSIEKLNMVLVALKNDKSELHEELSDANSKLKICEHKCDQEIDRIDMYSKRRVELEAEISLAETRLKKLSTLTSDCPTCSQHIDVYHLSRMKDQIKCDISLAKKKLENVKNVQQHFVEELACSKTALGAKGATAEAIRKDISDVDIQITLTKGKVEAANKRIDEFDTQLATLGKEENPYSTMLTTKRAKHSDLKNQVIKDTNSKDALEIEFEGANFWVKGFKRVRLFIIEQAFRTLEIEVNNSLAQLSMPDWQITFDIERENKSGGVTKGFVVFVKGPNNKVPVRWENWSGGETQRLQLAGDLGLANLIMHQNGLSNTFEAFDEPSTHLTQEGMLDLANMLHERAISDHKQIWIVDHTAISNFGDFLGIITVKKDSNGSSITYRPT
jgi:DNA repair exonuclease SbcCD ATPase subunit